MDNPTIPAPAAPVTTPSSTAAPTVTPAVELHSHSGLSITEAVTMAAWTREDLAKWTITQSQADAIITDLGTSTEDRQPDARTAAVRELVLAVPSARPHDYTIAYGRPGEHVEMMPELQAFDQSARTWMSAAGLPTNLGNAITKTVQTTHTMTPAELDSYGEAEYTKLEHIYGTALEDKLRAAGHMIEQLEATTEADGLARTVGPGRAIRGGRAWGGQGGHGEGGRSFGYGWRGFPFITCAGNLSPPRLNLQFVI